MTESATPETKRQIMASVAEQLVGVRYGTNVITSAEASSFNSDTYGLITVGGPAQLSDGSQKQFHVQVRSDWHGGFTGRVYLDNRELYDSNRRPLRLEIAPQSVTR